MSLIVSDTSPIHYLALIGQIEVLPKLFGSIIIPPAVFSELQQPNTPLPVKSFAASCPAWLEVRTPSKPIDASLAHLDKGEREAITLASEIEAVALLMDETKGRKAAQLHGLKTIGVMGVLFDAALSNLCDLEESFDKLQQTNFRAAKSLYEHFRQRYEAQKGKPT